MKNYGKNKEPSYLNYWEVNNLDGSVMLLKLPVAGLRWDENTAQFSKDYTENYNEDSKQIVFFEVNVQYPEKLNDLHSDLPFFPERIKTGIVEKFVANLHDKTEYVIHTRNLIQALNDRLVFKKYIESLSSTKKLA